MMRPRTMMILTVAALGAVPANTAGMTTGAEPRCHTGDLAGHVGAASAGAGQRYATLLLRNTSTHTCRVKGYIGGQLVRKSGSHLPTRIVRDHTKAPRTVALAPDQRAATVLHWTAVPGPGESTTGACEPTPYALRVTPPDETTQLKVRWRGGMVCQKGRIYVTPLAAHS